MGTQEIANSNLAIIASLSRLSSGGLRQVVRQPHQAAENQALFNAQHASSGESYVIQITEQAKRYAARAASTIASDPPVAYSAQATNVVRSLLTSA